MKRFYRVLSALLCVALLVPTLVATAVAATPDTMQIDSTDPVANAEDITVAFDIPTDNIYSISGGSHIILHFNVGISAVEIEKVKIVSLSSGDVLNGKWKSAEGDTQWQFIPYDIQDATYYTIVVPADVFSVNGKSMAEARTHTFRTSAGNTDVATNVASLVTTYDCVNRGFSVAASGYTLDQSTYKLSAFQGSGKGLQIDLRSISGGASAVNPNQNVRLPVLDEIWADSKYIGSTVKIVFDAKASEKGSIKLALNQHGNGNYVWGAGWGSLSENTQLTTEWQTYTCEFVVTEQMFDAKNHSTSGTPNITLGVRFTGFLNDSGTYKPAQINFKDFMIIATDDETVLNGANPVYVSFEEKDYSSALNVDLRFAVESDSANSIGIYTVANGKLGNKITTVSVNGAGIYTTDISDYIKSCTGDITIAFKAENTSIPVDLASTSFILSSVSTDTYTLPTVSSSVIASSPNATQNGLWISGGQSGYEDNSSVKSYIKLSLSGYNGGYAGFLFTAISEDSANVSVYGVSDVTAGQSWSEQSIEVTNAPANDVYGVGVNVNEVYGHAPLATFSVGSYEDSYRVDLSEFAAYMHSQGATSITIIIVSDAKSETNISIVDSVNPNIIDTFNGVTVKPDTTAVGFSNISGSLLPQCSEGVQIDLSTLSDDTYKDTSNVRISVFNKVWADESNVGKIIRLTFTAKSTIAGKVQLGLNQRQKYAFNFYGGIYNSIELTTEWNTYTFDFIVTQEMYDLINNTSSGIDAPGFALGIHFGGFNNGGKYKAAQITMRNFIVSQVPETTVIRATIAEYDCINTKPDTSAAGYTLVQTTYPFFKFISGANGGLQIDTRAITSGVAPNPNARINVFDKIWKDRSYIGRTVTFSFRAKATEEGTIGLTLNQRQKYAFNNFPGLQETAHLTTEWQTFTFSFVVTEDMYNIITNGDDPNGIEAPGLALGVRFTDFSDDATTYNNAQLLFADFEISTSIEYTPVNASAIIEDIISTIAEGDLDKTFGDVKYDFSDAVPEFKTLGYSAQNAGKIATLYAGELAIKPSLDTIQGPNARQGTLVSILDEIWRDRSNIGKTFTVSIRARATVAGTMDFALDVNNSLDIYKDYKAQYNLDTEYRTFNYTFTVTSDMFDNAVVGAFRFYNGYVTGGKYKDATIYIDEIRVAQDFLIDKGTLLVSDKVSISEGGVSSDLTAYGDASAVTADISKTYLSYNLTDVVDVAKAQLTLTISGANGQTVRVYLLRDTTLSANLTYANAPKTFNAAVLSFEAVIGENILDLTDIFAECEGTNIVLVFAIEHLSNDIQVTSTVLDLQVNNHNYQSESQRHEANAPTYDKSGNIEFYSCEDCGQLYLKNGNGDFVATTAEDIVLPPVEYSTKFSSVSLNIGKDLGMKYYVALSEGEGIDGFSARFTLNDLVVEVTEATYDSKSGQYAFTFCGIAPQLMGDTVGAELLKNGQLIDQKDYSVRQYVEKALELYPDDQKLKQLLADLVHYGAAAQQYIGYKADELVTDGLGLTASGATPTEADKQKTVSQSTNSNVQFTAAGVRFDYVNRIYVKFKATDISGVTVSVGGVNLEILETNTAGVYIAYSDAISALRFGEVVTFTLAVNGSAVQTLTYTVNDYAYAKHSDSRISDLALALYRYGKSALSYDSSK